MASRSWRRSAHAWLFLAPAGVLLLLFVAWPMLRMLLWSFQDARLLDPAAAGWAGLGNYSDLLGDPRFRRAFRNTALFALMVVPLQTALALLLALWVNRPEPWWRWLRVVFFLPVVVSMPVLAVTWTMLYQPARAGRMGLINAALDLVGLPTQAWLGDPRLALPAIAFMSIWQGVGFQMMICLAGLQTLPRELTEAALVDGAGPVSRLFFIIIPGIKNSLVFAVIVTTILSFRLFVQPYLMTGGGPQDSTISVVQWVYESTFLQHDLGRACAAAFVLLLLVATVSLAQKALSREERA